MFDSGLVDGDHHRRAYLVACLESWGSSSVEFSDKTNQFQILRTEGHQSRLGFQNQPEEENERRTCLTSDNKVFSPDSRSPILHSGPQFCV